MKINYTKGDIFKSIDGTKPILIPHVCNDIGGWGSGFVVAVSKFDETPEYSYRYWAEGKPSISLVTSLKLKLGEIQVVSCKDKVEVANMCAQHRTISYGEAVPIRYWALTRCMKLLADNIVSNTIVAKEIWCPRFGSGLAKGNAEFIETLIKEIWVDQGIPVTVFEL